MYAVGRLSSYISQGVYTVSAPFHPFGGAVDIIVVEQPDGSFKSSPWYVKFGKFQGVLKTKEKIVNVCIDGVEADFHMYLDHKGEAYFLREVDEEEIDPTIFSPPSSGDEIDDQSGSGRKESSKNYDFNVKEPNLDSPTDFDNGKIMVRTSSRRSRIFGLMFGRKSMKENNKREEGGDIPMERFSSLERAEIAADLLEVNWSTNLSTDISRRDNTPCLSARNMPTEEPDKGSQVNDEQGLASLLVQDSMENNFDHSVVQEATVPYSGELDNSSMSGIGDTECSNGVNSPDQSRQSKEQDNDIYMLGTGDLDAKFELISKTPTIINKFDLQNATSENREGSEFATSVPSVQNSHMGKHEGGSDMYIVEGPSDERVCLHTCVSNEESEVVYCEPSENSRVGVGSNGQGLETLNLSQEECEEAQVLTGDICETTKVIPEVKSQQAGAALMNTGNPNNIKLPTHEDSFRCEESSFREDTRNGVTESHSSLDIHRVTSESDEAEMLELIHRETIAERLGEGRNLQTELVEAFENQSQEIGSSLPCISGIREVHLEPSKAPGSFCQVVSGNLVHLVEEAHSRVCIPSSSSNSISLDQEEEDLGEEDEMNNLHSKNTAHLSNLLLESTGEDQFVFSDIDDFVPSGVGCEDSAFPDSVEVENDPLVTMTDIEDLNGSTDMDHKSHLSSIKLIRECSPKAFKALLEESTAKSSPMSIPGSRKCADEEIGWTIESLPNFRSHIDNLEISDVLHPLSHSLDSHSEKLRQEVQRKDVSSSSQTDLETNHQLPEDDPTVKDIRIWEEFKNMSTKSTVEISLCKHLLYEGMGADAASQAFDAEKVDLDKCASLGSQLVKNDNLVVRIGGRYFPWDAAASYVLEMLSLGHDQIIEPEGMIAVDQVEKTIEGEPPRSNVPSGGSWTLWPFSLGRSKTITPVRPAPDGTDDSNIVNASDSFSDATGNKSPPLAKVSKKKVKSIVPTSEQLASLNLNEGRNVITFTFSTAMLGKQQVDARIYLWKWNTRIVVSDVDGTITRSDVLGQFMPLVGKDWSHIGVTHLFSAIKENGYQLLFLSARAISQAYLTRQFLFNLKQDGKALPDGPVVISPDGLFPSLFREVIRRAPHEFKIACLQDIRALFPPDCSPFYAGFGNRITDEISYRKLGIPKGKIFIINARGEVAVNRRFDSKSYTSLHALVDGMFPPKTSDEQEDFNSWNYWRMPLPDINS